MFVCVNVNLCYISLLLNTLFSPGMIHSFQIVAIFTFLDPLPPPHTHTWFTAFFFLAVNMLNVCQTSVSSLHRLLSVPSRLISAKLLDGCIMRTLDPQVTTKVSPLELFVGPVYCLLWYSDSAGWSGAITQPVRESGEAARGGPAGGRETQEQLQGGRANAGRQREDSQAPGQRPGGAGKHVTWQTNILRFTGRDSFVSSPAAGFHSERAAAAGDEATAAFASDPLNVYGKLRKALQPAQLDMRSRENPLILNDLTLNTVTLKEARLPFWDQAAVTHICAEASASCAVWPQLHLK